MLGEDVSATQVSVLEMNKKNSCPLKRLQTKDTAVLGVMYASENQTFNSAI